MAAERSRRDNAGGRMTQLLEAEDEDDFYKTTYGGFEEEAEDNDYASEESDSESTDSDFSVQKRKSLRRSTAQKSKETQSRQKRREETARILKDIALKKNVKVEDVRRLTQEELLAEAKITEQINLKSLETYQKLELEKKRARVQKQVYRGPVVRYHSVTMPLITEDACLDAEINVDEEGDAQQTRDHQPSPHSTPTELCSRTFITFTDDKIFQDVFPQRKRKQPQRLTCPVTRLPAKYFDPITQTPYATAQAFKYIREAYAKQLEQEQVKCDSSPAVAQQRKREKVQSGVTVAE
ncbi:hypothetical protein BaRGS_00034983 [Batillaria attramentaria]|uniref:Vacuolar protein sorting-associated protein 72 homolog n=1 Tax=Batillaria attramentaria TaxID=370345 RepID=A0ABD0JFW7_9CAEN